MKPIIGISGSILQDASGLFPGYARAYVNDDYVQAVIASGGIPLIIPFNQDQTIVQAQIDLIDGLLLSGGHDVYPHNYNEEPHRLLGDVFPARDTFDFELVKYSEARQIPILGICRGAQLLNVYHGGSLYQDLSEVPNPDVLKHFQNQTPTLLSHTIKLTPETILATIFATDALRVNSFHHQVIHTVAPCFKVSAVALDGVVEAIEHEHYPWQVGVQWHPEMLHATNEKMKDLFSTFVAQAQKGKTTHETQK